MTMLTGDRLLDPAKVTDYLLKVDHPEGGPKAAFFKRFGFVAYDPDPMVGALLDHPDVNAIASTRRTPFGLLSEVRCSIATPDGRDPCILTIWMLEDGTDAHRFVTAYPV